jgi:arginase
VAVKIVRQPHKLVLLGVPSSAAALSAGRERAPVVLRLAGLVSRLKTAGYQVNDLGDDPIRTFKADQESPRARNIRGVLAMIETLKPRVELAVKSGALPLIFSGDHSIALGVVAGARRYFRHVGMVFMDSHARLLTPASTPDGSLDGMVASHLTGRGAAELVRFWGEPPLVRETGMFLFGVGELQPSEEEVFRVSPLRRYLAAEVRNMGIASAANATLDRIHASNNEFILHLSVTALAGFEAADDSASNGFNLDELREVLAVFVSQPKLAAIEVTGYNPAKDPNSEGAKLIITLLAEALKTRLEAAEPAPAAPTTEPTAAVPTAPSKPVAEPTDGEAWSSDSLAEETRAPAESSLTLSEDSEP